MTKVGRREVFYVLEKGIVALNFSAEATLGKSFDEDGNRRERNEYAVFQPRAKRDKIRT